MKIYQSCNWDDNQEIEQLLEGRGESIIETNTVWDQLFYGLQRGALSAVFACNGIGKSSFLVAMSKALAKKYRVLYVSTETDALDVYSYYHFGNVSSNLYYTYMSQADQKKELRQVVDELNIDILVYDYLGAVDNIGEWDSLQGDAKDWADFAIEKNIAILTAGQADSMLQEDVINKKYGLMSTPKYVSFSKHINDKLRQAAYIVRESTGVLSLISFKQRFGIPHYGYEGKYLIPINMEKKEFI